MLLGIFLATLFYTRVIGSLISLSIALLALCLDVFFLGVVGFPFTFFFSFSLLLVPSLLSFLAPDSSLIGLFVLASSLGVFSFSLDSFLNSFSSFSISFSYSLGYLTIGLSLVTFSVVVFSLVGFSIVANALN